jgi:hypothetical protein
MVEDADWYFFLDADDRMREDALLLNDFNAPATFGAVSLDGEILAGNVYPCGWLDIAQNGASGTLSMGFFCKASVARLLRFNTDLDSGEDFDFYMRLPGFTKRRKPLVDIGYSQPSAGGPRGYKKIDWTGICNRVITNALKREPHKYGLSGHGLLAKIGRAPIKPRQIPRLVC